MLIADGFEMLEISATVMGRQSAVHPSLIWDAGNAILVDAGFPGLGDRIREAIEGAGVNFAALNRIVITHQDIDHIGSLPEILAAAPQEVEVISGIREKPFIEGEKKLVKLTPEAIARITAGMPPEMAEERRQAMLRILENPPKAKVGRTVADGDRIDCCGGITVIDTPGHTPGHICLYCHSSKTLIAGDAMVIEDGQLLGPREQVTFDIGMARESLKKLTSYEIDRVVCYHGGLYEDGAGDRIAALAAQAA